MNQKRKSRMWLAFGVVLGAVAGLGCGSPPSETVQEEEPAATAGAEERPRAREDSVQISGLLGTIPRDQVENTLNPRMIRFQRCLGQGAGDVEYLAGDIRMSFRIHTDGTVAWVYPAESTFGHRATEQCILDVARQTRFPRPRGGEAEFSWGFGFDASEDVRPPIPWGHDSLGQCAGRIATVVEECNVRSRYEVTAYVEPGGAVSAAGGNLPDAASAETLDCILEHVREWEMPDPGSYAAKINFRVE